MGCSGVHRVWGGLPGSEGCESLILVNGNTSQHPFFLAFFGTSRATVVYRFWKGDCNMRIWESHHVLILTYFNYVRYNESSDYLAT